MSLKTDCGYFNEDNFIEHNGELRELTVTITLCEYRDLISERCYSEKAIESLQEENEKLKRQNAEYIKIITRKCPEIVKEVKTIADSVLGYNENTGNENEQ